MSLCACRCHAYGPGAYASCDVDTGSAGPGLTSCSPCEGAPTMDKRCVLGHAEPVEAEFGYACKRHYHWIGDTLRELETLWSLRAEVLLPGSVGDGRSGTRFGSPAPGRIEVLALDDKRAVPRGRNDEGVEDIPDVPGSLAEWVRLIGEEHPNRHLLDKWEPRVLTSSTKLVHSQRKWIVQQEWLDAFVDQITDLHRGVARGVGASMWPSSIGKCPNCQTRLFNTIGLDAVTCRKCQTTWTGVHLARLRLIHDQEQEAKKNAKRQAATTPADSA